MSGILGAALKSVPRGRSSSPGRRKTAFLRSEQAAHVFRQGCGDINDGAGDGVDHPQVIAVEGGAGDEGAILRAIEPVAGERAADGGHVDPQLLGAAGGGVRRSRARPWAADST